jgi:hypothetical protein
MAHEVIAIIGRRKFPTVAALALAAMLGGAAMPAMAHGGGSGSGGHGGGGGSNHGGGWGGHDGSWGGHGGFHGDHDHDGRGFHHHGFHGAFFGGFAFDDPYWGYPYPYYAYPYGYPGPVPLTAVPPQTMPAAAPQSFWYFCQSLNAYYPYVPSCPEPWRQVATTPSP